MKYQMHKASLFGLCILLTSLLLINISCYTSKMPDSAYQLEPNAVSVHYAADEKLNLYNNQPHALTLVVYQLTMPDLYYKYVAKSSGIEDLLRMEVDDVSITGKNRIDIQPGDKKSVEFARYTGTKYVAIVAGYDQLESGKVSEIFDIPIRAEKRLIFKPTVTIEKLLIYLQLGPEQIDKITANDRVRGNDGNK
jgi:type VI secretion system VasD/TssJ family lipoprotein